MPTSPLMVSTAENVDGESNIHMACKCINFKMCEGGPLSNYPIIQRIFVVPVFGTSLLPQSSGDLAWAKVVLWLTGTG